jgi:long-chain acyl-CoA synthetase
MTLDEPLHRHATLLPDKPALVTAERSITYADLDNSVSCLAQYLLDRGLRAGDRVAVHWSNSIEAAQLLLAAFRAGMIAVPINVRQKAPEIAYMLENSGARLCFSEPELAPLVKSAEVVSELPPLSGAGGPLPKVDDHQPAVLLYTSGTTARPKGVVHTHFTLSQIGSVFNPRLVGPHDTALAITQLAHATALCLILLPALDEGATAVLPRAFDPCIALDLIERFRCTFLVALPAMLQFVVDEQARRPRNVSSLRTVVAGGDTVPVALQSRFRELFDADVRELYGATEVGIVTTNPAGAVRTGSIGRLASGVSIRLADARGRDVEPGETGEILVRSPGVSAGYWNDAEATAALVDNGWMHTGDLAARDEDGYYWFKGRIKQLIIRGGSNISPQEVEEALYRHPEVMEAALVGARDPVYGEIPVAFVVLRKGSAIGEDDLRAFARELLADYKTPERVLFVEELPKGLTGKVDRRRLRDLLVAEPHLLEQHVVAVV